MSRIDRSAADRLFEMAARLPIDDEFPFRPEAIDVFMSALESNNRDGHSHYFLGLVFAGLSNLEKTTYHWEKVVKFEPENPRAQRNLGLAYLHQEQLERAATHFGNAFSILPEDSRILMELDLVRKELGVDNKQRLAFLKQYQATVETRDALLTSMLDLMVQTGEHEEALRVYRTHHFHNWEGRYTIHNAYMEACIGLAQQAEDSREALGYYRLASQYPPNLEIAPREPDLRGFLYYPMAKLQQEIGENDEATKLLEHTSRETSEEPTLASYYQALALKDLGMEKQSIKIFSEFKKKAEALQSDEGETPRWNSNSRKALGFYYLSKIYKTKGESSESQNALSTALELEPLIARRAIVLAQVAFAGAHQ